jgi:hypothetical protein
MFKVHIGYTVTGRNRWRRFATVADATTYVNAVWARTGVILSIVAAT